MCKKCRSKQESHNAILRKARKDPTKYLECNDCDRVFSKYRPAFPIGNQITLLTHCKFCKSEDVYEFSNGETVIKEPDESLVAYDYSEAEVSAVVEHYKL